MRRPVIIFDFGNVIALFDFKRAFEVFGRHAGLTASRLADLLTERGYASLLGRYESGAMTSDEFSRSVGAIVGADLPHETFASAWVGIFEPNPGVDAIVAGLRSKGYTLLLGSNTNELHATFFREHYSETLAHFDHLVLSHEVGHLKPSTDFYHACARMAGADPSECVFIDDRPENVEGARHAGLTGILFTDVPTLVEDLRRLGIEV